MIRVEVKDGKLDVSLKTAEHTPLPWYRDKQTGMGIHSEHEQAYVAQVWHSDKGHANAALIVRAVNSHEALVKACERAADALNCLSSRDKQAGTVPLCDCFFCEVAKELQAALALAKKV